jgi:hypothetical protein
MSCPRKRHFIWELMNVWEYREIQPGFVCFTKDRFVCFLHKALRHICVLETSPGANPVLYNNLDTFLLRAGTAKIQ